MQNFLILTNLVEKIDKKQENVPFRGFSRTERKS